MGLKNNKQYQESSFGIPSLFRLPTEQRVSSGAENNIPSNIWLVDIEVQNWGTPAQSYTTISKLKIQTVPEELGVDPRTNWATIPVLGRNVPHYQYVGGEKILQFTIDWYSNHPYKRDVIEKCRWVEALSQNDGWNKAPSVVLLIWGDLYKNTTWIVERAPYRLKMFDKEYGMLPRQAYQEITLKQISATNPTKDEILHPGLISPSQGVNGIDSQDRLYEPAE